MEFKGFMGFEEFKGFKGFEGFKDSKVSTLVVCLWIALAVVMIGLYIFFN